MHKRLAAGAISLGSAMFSGSIYAMILLKMRGFQNSGKLLGPVRPLGGILKRSREEALWTAY